MPKGREGGQVTSNPAVFVADFFVQSEPFDHDFWSNPKKDRNILIFDVVFILCITYQIIKLAGDDN